MDKIKDYIKTLLKLAIQNNPEVLKVVRMAKVENDKWISIKKGDEVVHLPLDGNNKIDTKRIEQWKDAERGIKQELGDKVKKVEVEEPHIAKWKSKKNVDILEGNDNLFVVGQGNNYGIVEDGELVEHYGKYGSYYWSSNKNLILDKYNKLKKSGEEEKYLNAPKSAYTLQKEKNGVGLYRYGDYYKVYKDDNLLYVTDKSDKEQYALEHYTGKYANLYDYDSPEYWDSIQTALLKKEKGIYNYNPDQKRDKKGRWTKENYNAEIDRIVKGELKSADRIKVVEHPSEPWLKAGLQDAEMLMSVKTYSKATTDKHNVSEETMRNLPDLIDDPLYIFKSSTVPGSYVGVLDDYEEENGIKKPLIAVVKPEHGKIDVNLIPSVYGKDPDFPYREVFKNNLLYERLDKNKTVSNNIIASIAMETLKPSNTIITDNREDFNPNMNKHKIDNDKWITIHPNGEDSKGRPLLLKDGETPKEAIERTYKKEELTEENKKYTWQDQKYSLQDLVDAGFEPIKYTSSIYKDDPLTYLAKEEGKKYYRMPLTESEYQDALKAKENKKANALQKAKKASKDLIDYVKWQYNEDIEPYITRKEGDKTIVDWYDLPRGAKSALQQIQRGGRLVLDMYSGREMSIEIKDKKILENLQRHRANNNKEQNMALLYELKKLITKVENDKVTCKRSAKRRCV